MPDFATAIALLKKPIEELYGEASGAIKERIAIIRTAAKVKSLHKRLWESQRVKTIWQTDRPLSLNSFFYPVKVLQERDGRSVEAKLTALHDLPDRHNIIFGTVGQGKSILLRYLLGKEIKSGTSIPVLCELRNIENESLEEYLIKRFSLLLNIESDTALFEFFSRKGKISFL